jgi:hypothetical protein
MEDKGNLTKKDIHIESESLKGIKTLILQKRVKFENRDEIIQELLRRFDRKSLSFEKFDAVNKRKTGIHFDKETLTIYESIEKSGRSYVINGLLRT